MYNREYFNGVGYVPLYMPEDMDAEKAAEYIGDLGAVCVRLWHQFVYFLEAPDRIRRDKAEYMHKVISALRKNGVKRIISVNHDWFLPDKNGNPAFMGSAMPRRNTEEYNTVLDWYEESWKTMAKEFDDVDGWETGNEANHVPFLHALDGEEFDLVQKADICTDMMLRSARAIHSVTNDKIIVMPGMAPIGGERIGVFADNVAVEYDGMVRTLERIYQNIESGDFGSTNPRDYFDKLCWHPYYAKQTERGEWRLLCPDKDWVEVNKAVYAVAQAHGDGDVGCYFSEYGYNDGNNGANDKELSVYITEGLRLAKEEMLFVESVQVYRLFSFLNVPDVWDDYSLCDARILPPRKKEKYNLLKIFYKTPSEYSGAVDALRSE